MGIIHMPGFCGFGRCCAGRASIDHMGKMFFPVALGLFSFGSVSFIVALSHYWYQKAAQEKGDNPSS
jgi:hypothetical protein